MISKRDLRRQAIRIEQEVLKEDVGCQDQIWAAYGGGFNRIDFHQDGTFSVMRSFCRRRGAPSLRNR